MKSFLFVMFFAALTNSGNAQHVKIRLGFPAGVSVRATGPAVTGRVWVGPEWVWRGGRYECVPGYWAEPRRRGAIWVPGHWKSTRFGYKWIPGHWK